MNPILEDLTKLEQWKREKPELWAMQRELEQLLHMPDQIQTIEKGVA